MGLEYYDRSSSKSKKGGLRMKVYIVVEGSVFQRVVSNYYMEVPEIDIKTGYFTLMRKNMSTRKDRFRIDIYEDMTSKRFFVIEPSFSCTENSIKQQFMDIYNIDLKLDKNRVKGGLI